MRRSIFKVSALAIGAAMTISACSSGGSTAASTDAATTAAPAKLSGSLTVWVDETRIDVFKKLATEYQAQSGVAVTVVQKPSADIRATFIKQEPTGAGPDIVVGAHDWTGELVADGAVSPLQLGDKQTQFSPVSVSAFTYQGQVYGVPYAVENIALVRNDALLTSTPSTFSELLTQAKASGAKYPFLVQQDPTGGDAYHLYPFQTSFGAPVFTQNADGSYTSDLALGSAAGLKYAQFLRQMGKEGVFSGQITADKAKQLFLDGKSPYILTGPWYTADFIKAGLKISVLQLPSAGGQPALPFVGVQGAYVSAKAKNPIVANDFAVNFLGSEAVQTELYQAGGRLPALTAAADKVDDAVLKGFGAAAGTAPMPSVPAMGSVWTFWGATEIQIIGGKAKDPAAAWTKMTKNIQAAIDKSAS